MNKIFTLPTYFGMIVIVIMALLTGFDVVGRYVFNSPIPGTFELTEALMSIVVASGIAKATQMGEHISVDALYVKLSAPTQRWLTLTERIIGPSFFWSTDH
ncbi:MAG: TRAP transporter small permease [Betaproteobacteria bacterium]